MACCCSKPLEFVDLGAARGQFGGLLGPRGFQRAEALLRDGQDFAQADAFLEWQKASNDLGIALQSGGNAAVRRQL